MNTQNPFVITISREVGSGGHTVGKILSEKLGVRFSDKQLIKALMDKFNLSVSAIEEVKGKKKNWLADFFRVAAPMPRMERAMVVDVRYVQEFRPEITSSDVYEAEVEIIKGIAEEGSCVIAGRSACFILKDHPNILNIFITASKERRIARVMEKQGYSREQAEVLIDSIDQARDNYVTRYSGTSRYDSRHYDLVLKMDGLTEEEAADLILAYIHKQEQ